MKISRTYPFVMSHKGGLDNLPQNCNFFKKNLVFLEGPLIAGGTLK